DAGPVDHSRLLAVGVSVGLGQERALDLGRVRREMKETLGQLNHVLLDGFIGLNIDTSETVTGTNLVVRHQTDKQPLVFQGGQKLAVFLAYGPVDGVADEFTKS